MRRIEKDPEGGWIARRRDGSLITDKDWRWNSRSAARHAVMESDFWPSSDTCRQSGPTSRRPATGSCAPRHDKE